MPVRPQAASNRRTLWVCCTLQRPQTEASDVAMAGKGWEGARKCECDQALKAPKATIEKRVGAAAEKKQLQPSLEPVSHHTHQCDSLQSQTRPGELIRVSSRPAPALPYRRYPAQHPSAQCTSRPTVSSTGHSCRLAAMNEPTLHT